MNDIEDVIVKLKKSGMKLTTQRLAILDILKGNKSHPTAMDIYKKLKVKQPTVPKSRFRKLAAVSGRDFKVFFV